MNPFLVESSQPAMIISCAQRPALCSREEYCVFIHDFSSDVVPIVKGEEISYSPGELPATFAVKVWIDISSLKSSCKRRVKIFTPDSDEDQFFYEKEL